MLQPKGALDQGRITKWAKRRLALLRSLATKSKVSPIYGASSGRCKHDILTDTRPNG